MRKTNNLIHLLFIYLFLVFGYSFSNGFFSLPGIILIFVSFIYLFFLFLKKQTFFRENIAVNYEYFLKITLLVSSLLALYFDGPIYANNNQILIFIELLYFFAIVLIFAYFFNTINKKKLFFSLFFIALLLRIITIISSAKPYIDVFEILTRGTQELLSGNNPYSIKYQQLYPGIPADNFGYLPGIFIFTIPASAVFTDVRTAMILSQIFTCFLLYKLIGKQKDNTIIQLLILLYLYNPLSCFIIEQTWLEPIINLLITGFAYLIITGNKFLSAVIFGLLLTAKQYHFLTMLPLVRLIKGFSIKYWIISIFIFLVISSPFFIWNGKDFISDTFFYQINFQKTNNLFTKNLIHSSLSINSLYYFLVGKDIPFFVIFSLLSIIYLFVLLSKNRNIYYFIIGTTIWLFSFFFFNRMAFLNYYFLISFLLLLTQVIYLKINKL